MPERGASVAGMPRLAFEQASMYVRILPLWRLALLTFTAVLTLAPLETAYAQQTPRRQPVPAEVRADVDAVFNSPLTRRIIGPVTIGPDDFVATDLAVLDGPLVIRGTVSGSVLAVNAPVRLDSGAVVQGSILIVGGELEQRGNSRIDGSVRVHPVRVNVRWDGSRLTLLGAPADSAVHADDLIPDWFERIRRRDTGGSGFTITSGGTYNRVEGLAVQVGPRLRRAIPGGGLVTLEALGILRSAESFRWDGNNIGHKLTAVADFGGESNLSVGARLHDVVAPAEQWMLSDAEAGLAAFLGQRDFRDHYSRHGGEIFGGLVHGDLKVDLRLTSERWGALDTRSVPALFQGSKGFRANPRLDAGRVKVAELSMGVDTRNRALNPWSGWFVQASYEAGSGRLTRETVIPDVADAIAGTTDWGRFLLDVRHYSRISPSAQLNARVVLGGWLHGDALPLQRRFALGGPGSLPGYDFMRPVHTADPLTCSTEPGGAGLALCDRVMLLQVDYKGELPAPRWPTMEQYGWPATLHWVVFGDAGRGWLVDRGPAELSQSSWGIPDPGTWLSSVGAGIEAGALGVYISRAVSTSGRSPNLFIRLGQRF